jgi:hypothetical protein
MELYLEVLPVRKRGRPSRYNSASCDRALVLAAEGCGKAEIAAGLGVSVKTLNAWAAAYEDFRQAMSEAKELEYAWWLWVGHKNQFKRSWNASAWALQMRNRFRKRFGGQRPAKDETPEESMNAEQLRAEMERIPGGPDAGGVEKPSV